MSADQSPHMYADESRGISRSVRRERGTAACNDYFMVLFYNSPFHRPRGAAVVDGLEQASFGMGSITAIARAVTGVEREEMAEKWRRASSRSPSQTDYQHGAASSPPLHQHAKRQGSKRQQRLAGSRLSVKSSHGCEARSGGRSPAPKVG